jgi:N-dimethylarginine dimethylaminohydrolase
VIWKKFILKISAFLKNNGINVKVAKVGGVLLHFEMKFSIVSPSKKCIMVPWPFPHMSIE